MSESASLPSLFQGLHRRLESELGIARDVVGHAGTKGAVSEERWIEMLQEHLPKRYAVNSAFVIDSKGRSSQQIDIVIHDRQYSPFVLNLGSAMYVPAESVYAVLEVKQVMNAENIAYAAEKAASVRALHRTSLPIKHAGGELPPKPLHHIMAGLVALESDWTPPFGRPFTDSLAAQTNERRLDIGCAARTGVFQAKYAPTEPPFVAVECSAAPLALFLLRLISNLQNIATVPCIDVAAYAASIPIMATPAT